MDATPHAHTAEPTTASAPPRPDGPESNLFIAIDACARLYATRGDLNAEGYRAIQTRCQMGCDHLANARQAARRGQPVAWHEVATELLTDVRHEIGRASFRGWIDRAALDNLMELCDCGDLFIAAWQRGLSPYWHEVRDQSPAYKVLTAAACARQESGS